MINKLTKYFINQNNKTYWMNYLAIKYKLIKQDILIPRNVLEKHVILQSTRNQMLDWLLDIT